MKSTQKIAIFAGMSFFALLLVLVSAGCSQSEAGENAGDALSPTVTPSALASQRPDDAGNSSDLDEIVARYRAVHPPDSSSSTAPPLDLAKNTRRPESSSRLSVDSSTSSGRTPPPADSSRMGARSRASLLSARRPQRPNPWVQGATPLSASDTGR